MAIMGRWKTATLLPLFLIASLFFLAETRLIANPAIFFFFTINYVMATLISALYCLIIKPISTASLGNTMTAIGFVALASMVMLIAASKNQLWLGLHVYFIPSISMQPTLQPGQFIIVDTLAYEKEKPRQGDVIVFQRRGDWLVKRIAAWPNREDAKPDTWYVMGDNRAYSKDSRHFGSIETQEIDGKAVFILASMDQNRNISTPAFKEIK